MKENRPSTIFIKKNTSNGNFQLSYDIMIEGKSEEDFSLRFDTIVSDSKQSKTEKLIMQDHLFVWIVDNDYQDRLTQLKNIINKIDVFTDPDEAIDFISNVEKIKVFLILENNIGQRLIPRIHNMPQIHAIYIFDNKQIEDAQWIRSWNKIRGIHTHTNEICQVLERSVKQFNQNNIPVSFVSKEEVTGDCNLNELDPLFMYTQIFKEILLGMSYTEQAVKDFTTFFGANDGFTPAKIDQFEKEYQPQSAVFWYTKEKFLYSQLNLALRTMQADAIIKMGFFIHDLHCQIESLHQQHINANHEKIVKLYRGQSFSEKDFKKLLKAKDGLISFNNFLSTSRDETVSKMWLGGASQNPGIVDILFEISVDSNVPSAPFALIEELSRFSEEKEVLFAMHSVFRVNTITLVDNNEGKFYRVELKLTADDDKQLRLLTERISAEIVGDTGWKRLGILLLRIAQFDQAEKLYNTLGVSDLRLVRTNY